MVNQIVDEFTDLDITPQQRYRLRHPEKDREYYEENRERINELHKLLKRNQRIEVIEMLGGKCIKCGFSDWRALEIDHINGGGRKERTQFSSYWSYLNYVMEKIKNGSKDYQLLCSNCNSIKEYDEEK